MSVFTFHYYPQHLLYQDNLERKLGNTYIKCFQSCYSTIHRDTSSSNANTICLEHAQHMTLENRLSQIGNTRSKVACAVLCRTATRLCQNRYSMPWGPGPKMICIKGVATVRCTSFLRHPLALSASREGLSCPSGVIWGVPWHLQKWWTVCWRPVPCEVELKQGTLSWHQIPAPLSSVNYSISAQLIFPLSFLPPHLPTPLVLLSERHVPHPSVLPWEEADRLLPFMSALARIILGTGQESCLELQYS